MYIILLDPIVCWPRYYLLQYQLSALHNTLQHLNMIYKTFVSRTQMMLCKSVGNLRLQVNFRWEIRVLKISGRKQKYLSRQTNDIIPQYIGKQILNIILNIQIDKYIFVKMWNQFLNQSRTQRKSDNTPVLVLGNKHSGKRSLVDTLFDISKTTIHTKRLSAHSDTNKMKLRGLSPIIDYAYLNVLDLTDPDYRTHCKLEVYMIEDKLDSQIFSQLEKPEILKKAVVIIMLDFTKPWTFMEELDGWISFLYELQKRAGFSIVDLEQMATNISKYYKAYKEPQFDQNGKVKKYFDDEKQNEQQIDIPLPEGVLTNNIRLPLIVCVNKCDLQSSVLRQESANKIQIIMYHLRKFCVQYGGSLVYTSIKNNSNLNTLYEYVLHRAYKMPLRFKAQTINEQAIFIPFGSDNLNLIQDSILKLDVSKSYSQAIQRPLQKKAAKEEVVVEDDAQFFKKYISSSSTSTPSVSTINSLDSRGDDSSSNSTTKSTQVTKFFKKLLENNQQNPDEQRRSNAQNDLMRHTTLQASMTKQPKKE